VDKITGEYVKKRRLNREDRDKARKEHREEMKEMKRGYTYGKKKAEKGASTTNIEKRKSKPYSMVRHKALRKLRRSAGLKRKIKSQHVQKLASQKLDHKH